MYKSADRWPTLVVQLSSVCIALAAAWLLRFDFSFPYPHLVLTAAPVLLACRWGALSRFQLTHNYWRFTGIRDLTDLVKSTALGSLCFLLIVRIIGHGHKFPETLPLSIVLIEGVLSLMFLSALRVTAVFLLQERAESPIGGRTKILIVGAGHAAALLLKAIQTTKYEVVGLLDDDRGLLNVRIHGVPVLGSIDQLPELVLQYNAKEVLIAIPSASGSQMLRITEYCTRAGVTYRAVPQLADLIEGKLEITELREVNFEDLLGREPVKLDSMGMRKHFENRVVMVTGAAGSIGSELCKQIVRYAPRQVICVDQSETPLFNLQQELLKMTDIPVVCAVTDVGDKRRMRRLLLNYQVEVIFNAAAYKHVPMVEANAYEGIRNNVFALLDLFEVAEECGCEDFLLISSDKAVNPSSLMGCTKRLGEMVVASRQRRSMRCVSVRFGNVLGSQGSVIPMFQTQIRENRPITVTHPEITRYFMTIPEAVSLVLQAFTIGEHGDILVLEMGEPIPIVDLAKTLIRISGKTEEEIPIVFTGLRPGEKLHESLFYDFEKRAQTSVSKVMRAQSLQMNWFHLLRGLRELEAAMRAHDEYRMRCVIKELIPEYQWVPARTSQMHLITHRRRAGVETPHPETTRPILPAPIWIEAMRDHDASRRVVHEA